MAGPVRCPIDLDRRLGIRLASQFVGLPVAVPTASVIIGLEAAKEAMGTMGRRSRRTARRLVAIAARPIAVVAVITALLAMVRLEVAVPSLAVVLLRDVITVTLTSVLPSAIAIDLEMRTP